MLCEAIMNQVRHVYDYLSPTNVDINSDEDVRNILNFIQFIEYDHEEYLAVFKTRNKLEKFPKLL